MKHRPDLHNTMINAQAHRLNVRALQNRIWIICLSVWACACTSLDDVSYPMAVEIAFSQQTVSLEVGDAIVIHANLIDASGASVRDISAEIQSLDESVAKLESSSTNGVALRAIGAGSAQLEVVIKHLKATMPVVVNCPSLPANAAVNVTHIDDITTSETWHAADGTHVVSNPLTIVSNDKNKPVSLTIQSCAQVHFAEHAGLQVGNNARLLVEGGPSDEGTIRFNGINNAKWAGLRLLNTETPPSESSESVIRHAILQGAENGIRTDDQTISPSSTGYWRMLLVDTVRIESSGEYGIQLGKFAGLSSASKQITIQTSGIAPIKAHATVAHTIPRGQYTGNQRDVLQVVPDKITRTIIWFKHDVPYHLLAGELVVSGEKDFAPSLEMPDLNTTVLFDEGAGLSVGTVEGEEGGLVLGFSYIETPKGQRRAIFKHASDDNEPIRSWRGVTIGSYLESRGTLIQDLLIEGAGGARGINGYDGDYRRGDDGALILMDSGLLDDSRLKAIAIQNSAGYGIVQAFPAHDVTNAKLRETGFLNDHPEISKNSESFQQGVFSPANPLDLALTQDEFTFETVAGAFCGTEQTPAQFQPLTWSFWNETLPLGNDEITAWGVVVLERFGAVTKPLWAVSNLAADTRSLTPAWYETEFAVQNGASSLISAGTYGPACRTMTECETHQIDPCRLEYLVRIYALNQLLDETTLDKENGNVTLDGLTAALEQKKIGVTEARAVVK